MLTTDEPADDRLSYEESELRLVAIAIVLLDTVSTVFATHFGDDSHRLLCKGLSALLDETLLSHTLPGEREKMMQAAAGRVDEWTKKPA